MNFGDVMNFRPMLAETCEDLSTLKLPGILSPKLDGIRCVVLNGQALTRKLKPVPNNYIREFLSNPHFEGFDGELMIRGASNFNEIQSGVMSENGTPPFIFHVFDKFDESGIYEERMGVVFELLAKASPSFCVQPLPYVKIHSLEEILQVTAKHLEEGFEGSMYRSLDGLYKHGRSTLKQQWLLKIKKFKDSEAKIIGFEEQLENQNEKELDERGLSKRSTKKEGMAGKGTLGAFLVEKNGEAFAIGTGEGLTHKLRQELWDKRETLVGKLVKYKFFEEVRPNVPRFPIFLGFRDERDF